MKRNKLWRRQQGLKRAKKVWNIWKAIAYRSEEFDCDNTLLRRLYKTRVPCSCMGCGNRRKWEGKTLQERKAELDLQ